MQDIVIRPSIKFWIVKSFWKLAIFLSFVIAIMFFPIQFLFQYFLAGGLVLMILLSFADYLLIKQTTYIVKVEQIVVITGIFSRTTNYMEMYRIYDYLKERNIFERILGLMTVKIFSRDANQPLLTMSAIPLDTTLIDNIRSRVELQKQIKHVYEINNKI